MNGIISRLRQSGTLTFWLILILLVFAVGIVSVAVPLHVYYAHARNRVEPEIAIHPENKYQRVLHVVGDVDYKPFSYLHDSEPDPHGYDIELVSELVNRMKVNLDLQLMEWNDAVERMQERKADLILGCDWQDASVMDCSFTIPTFEEKFVAFELEPSDSFSDLYEKRIAVIEGCGLKETLERYQLWSNCTEYDTVTACAQAVLKGECDCFIAHHTIGEVSLRSFGREGKRFRGRMDIASGQMCFGVTEDNPELFEKVNETLLTMRADGTMDTLAGKWLERFDADVTLPEYMRKHPIFFFLILDLLLAVVVVFLVMNHFLIRIRREKDRAIAAEQSKSLFFSTVSHDIRTPLNAIIGFSEMLRNGIEDKEEQKQAFDAIATSGQTLLDLINDVLDLSKLDAGKIVFVSELTDINKLASGVLHSFDVSVFGRDVELIEKTDPIPFLYVDPHRIRQILFNLIGNAVKFTEHGNITLSASFEKDPASIEETGTLTFSVSDTGCGIAEDDLENVLKPFVQAKNTKAAKGTGLGLSICCQLAERMGGKLSLKSAPGEGSTFTVVIPNVRFSTKEKPKIVETTGQIAIQAAQSNISSEAKIPRILIVDDVPVNVKVIQSMLRRLNVTDVVTAGNGAEALEILRSDPSIGIVLTDMWMPVMDGEGLIREIRKEEQWKDLRVYAVTADVETQKTFKDSGFTGILLKPIKIGQLQSIIESMDGAQ